MFWDAFINYQYALLLFSIVLKNHEIHIVIISATPISKRRIIQFI